MNIVGILKSGRISWAGHVWRTEGQTVNDITIWKPEKKDWEDDQDNGEFTELEKILEIREGEQLAKVTEVCKAVVEAAIDLQDPE